jgi:hypothetical protein
MYHGSTHLHLHVSQFYMSPPIYFIVLHITYTYHSSTQLQLYFPQFYTSPPTRIKVLHISTYTFHSSTHLHLYVSQFYTAPLTRSTHSLPSSSTLIYYIRIFNMQVVYIFSLCPTFSFVLGMLKLYVSADGTDSVVRCKEYIILLSSAYLMKIFAF